MLDAQFILPGTYQSYKNETDFAAFYPFVPYQFQLIMKVLDSFVNMNYVDKQVKGNERSLLNITFSIAKETAECEVGEFIPFDRSPSTVSLVPCSKAPCSIWGSVPCRMHVRHWI